MIRLALFLRSLGLDGALGAALYACGPLLAHWAQAHWERGVAFGLLAVAAVSVGRALDGSSVALRDGSAVLVGGILAGLAHAMGLLA